ncbi:MAG: DNRLRE domain-containing protein, partial [Umezawaea sp.]
MIAAAALTGAQSPGSGPGLGGLPAGASLSAPEQRGGTAAQPAREASTESTKVGGDLPHRAQPRPADAVDDHAAPLPEAQRAVAEQQHVTPEVVQTSTAPVPRPGATERPGDRTADTETFDNPDGSRTLRVHSGDSNVRGPDGSWRPVDLALATAEAGRLTPKASPVEVSFAPRSADGALVRISPDADHAIAYGMRDVADVPAAVTGPTATYRGVHPGVDLRLTAARTGAKEDLVLASATTPTAFSFTLTTTRLEPRLTDAGDISLVDGDRVVSVIPAGFMDDAAGVRSTGVRYALTKSGASTWILRVDLDAAWLHDPARVFPVVADPSVGTYNTDSDDTYVQSGASSGHSTEAVLIAGSVGDGRGTGRAYLHFGSALAALHNKYVHGAALNLNNSDVSCAAQSFTAFEVTQGWNTAVAWPGAAVGRALSTGQLGSCANNRWSSLTLPGDVMSRWTHDAAMGHGLSVRASNEADGSGHRFASANSANAPYLDVVYSEQGASFEVTDVLLPDNAHKGNLKAKVTNLGTSPWIPGNGYRFGYIVKQGNTSIRTATFAPTADTGPLGVAVFDVPIDPLPPGDYQVYLTMFTPQGPDFFVAHQVAYGLMALKVSNLEPTSDRQEPGSGAVVESLTPTLYAEGRDPDNWPAKGLTYRFIVCANAQLTEACQESDWTAQSWTPQPLRWSRTYFWAVKVYDTVDPTRTWVGPLALTTRVPQPQITSHLAGNPDSVQGPGLASGIGNYSTVVTDASVATVGPDLTITRTYNSLDPRRNTAFGVGWASRLDARLDQDDDRSGNVVVTYPTGRQVRFGKNPDATYASPLGDSTALVFDSASGTYTLRDTSAGRWKFDVLGRLVTITDAAGLTQQLAYDTSDHVRTITSDTSGRTLSFTWQGGHVATVTTQAPEAGGQPLVWTYTVEGDRLTRACVPGDAPNCTNYTHTSGSHYRSSVLDDNPKAYWRLGENTGDRFANATARRDGDNAATQHGVILGGDGALAGTTDKSATFDGNSSHVTLPDGLTTASMSLAVEMWFKTTRHGTLIGYADQAFPAGTPTKSTPVLYVGTDGLL